MKFVLFSKYVVLLGIGLLLFGFLALIQGLIADRQQYRSEAVQSVSDSVAGAQTLLGPLAYVSCTETWPIKVIEWQKEKVGQDSREFHVVATPLDLDISSKVTVEKRHRSLFETQVLSSDVLLKAQLHPSKSLAPTSLHANSVIKCGNAHLMIALDDPRGIRHASLRLNDEDYKFQAGTGHAIYKRGMHVELPEQAMKTSEPWKIQIKLEYAGTQSLSFVPLADSTQLQMHSNWPHPSFTGRFAPAERSVTDSGFTAKWRLTSLATTAGETVRNDRAAQIGTRSQVSTSASAYDAAAAAAVGAAAAARGLSDVESIDIRFVEPINFYSLSDRASKYGLLFIALTFVAVGLFEVMKRLRVHPVQYLLVGVAICTFFLLLVALSEHIGFTLAYAAGAAATTFLLMFYASYMLGGWLRGLPFGSLIALLYGMLYALLQLEQTALAIGAVALFAVLATVMVLTRKVDWYSQLAPTTATLGE